MRTHITPENTPVKVKKTHLKGLITVFHTGDYLGYNSTTNTSYVLVNGRVENYEGEINELPA